MATGSDLLYRVTLFPNTTSLLARRSEYVMIKDQNLNVSYNSGLTGMELSTAMVDTNYSMLPPSEDANDKPVWSFGFAVVMACILSISSIVTIVGNAMVLTVIIRHRGMRTRTNLFLVNLAIADFLVGLTVVPFSITTLIHGRWIFGSEQGDMCSVNGWLNALCLTTSIHTLMYIGINKYCSIVHPLSNPIKLYHIVIMMIAAWIWGAFCATITVAGLSSVKYKKGTSQCGPDYPKDFKGYCFHGIVQITVIVIPFCILVFCYIQMFREIKRHSNRLRNNTTVEENFILAQNKKVAITLFIVLATFIVMALPYHAYATFTTISKDKSNFPGYINPIAYCFLYLNSMCNPIIYALRSPAFRDGYKEILCQTPNYVMRDDSDNVRSRRFSSICSRRSRRTISQLSYAIDNETVSTTSPLPLLSHKPEGCQDKCKKKKTLSKLIRSTGHSSNPCIIHRDDDIIIVKGGKVISVRQRSGSDASLANFRETPFSNSIAHAVVSGLTLDPTKDDDGDDVERINFKSKNCLPVSPLSLTNSTTTSTTVVEKDNHLKSKNSKCESNDYSNKGDNDYCANGITKTDVCKHDGENPRNEVDDEIIDYSSVATVFKPAQSRNNHGPIKARRNAPDLKIDISRKQNPFSLCNGSSQHTQLAVPTLSKMVAGVASTTSDILGMPLTPFTRNNLAKSDMHLDADSPLSSSSRRHLQQYSISTVSHSHSSDDLLALRSRFHRHPSLEYLDPPIPIFRSLIPT